MRTFRVPVTMTDERIVTVRARSAAEAVEKVGLGRYQRLGRTISRGFLVIREAEEVRDG